MPAYVITEVTRIDSDKIGAYLAIARPSIAKYGGRYLASSEQIELIEGASAPQRMVVIEFESVERAREWYASPEYAPALALSTTALDRRLMIVDGGIQ